MNILVAVDLSPGSDKVVAMAGDLARRMDASVHVLHVAGPDPDNDGHEEGSAPVPGDDRVVRAFAERLRESGVDATALQIQGPTVRTTLSEARRLEAGMIVVGSHGHGAMFSVLVGSYSAEIIRLSQLPVLVVPIREEDQAAAGAHV